MDIKSIIELIISSLSAFAVLGSLSFTTWFQIKNKSEQKEKEIKDNLNYLFDKYRGFKYEYYSEQTILKPNPFFDPYEFKSKIQMKEEKIWNSPDNLLNQFVTHYKNYLYEIYILITEHQLKDFLYCQKCKREYKINEWIIFLNDLKIGQQWEWNAADKIFYSNKKISTWYCIDCLEKQLNFNKFENK